jgi:agmatinase
MAGFQEKWMDLPKGTVAVLGVPVDENSSFLRGSALAPAQIRKALHSDSANLSTELGVDLGSSGGWAEIGDLSLSTGRDAMDQIEAAVAELIGAGMRVLSLGGDHSVSYPIIRAHAKAYKSLNVLHLDAHPDTYDEFGGSKISHACPFARVMEEGLGVRLVQIGIRTLNPHQSEQAKRFGLTAVEMKDWPPAVMPRLDAPLYVSIDMDVFDPAFAPGISHHEPGGMSTRDVLRLIHGLPTPVVGADIVEFNPTRDQNGVTAMLAAKLCKELLGQMLAPPVRPSQKP